MVDAIHQVELILGVESLLSMNGIIPSIPLFRDQMRQRIVALGLTLTGEGCPSEQNAVLCALLSRLVDTRIMATLRLNHQYIAYSTLEKELHSGILTYSEYEAIHSLQISSHPLIEELSTTFISWSESSKKYTGNVINLKSESTSKSPTRAPSALIHNVKAHQADSIKYLLLFAMLFCLLTSLWFYLKTL